MACPFCNPDPDVIVVKSDLAYARYDIHPISPGHLLLIPFRHVASAFDLTDTERLALARLAGDARAIVDRDHHPDGYNIGVNIGEAAGQAIMHTHVHFIPRYRGDAPHPGGITRVKAAGRGREG